MLIHVWQIISWMVGGVLFELMVQKGSIVQLERNLLLVVLGTVLGGVGILMAFSLAFFPPCFLARSSFAVRVASNIFTPAIAAFAGLFLLSTFTGCRPF